MPRTSDKKERLVGAAKTLIHRQGFNQTSLADIAHVSGVPLGNVYYYFKTKEDIASAVISEHDACIKQMMQRFEEADSDPRVRLILFLNYAKNTKEVAAKYGCPIASLCQELDKKRNLLSEKVDSVLKYQLQWVTAQFQLMGKQDAVESGQQFIASLSGCMLLSNALDEPQVVEVQVNRIIDWILDN